MSKKYIAYGSNLSVRQMAHRCPDAMKRTWTCMKGTRPTTISEI